MLETKKFDSLEALRGWIDDNQDLLGKAREFTLVTEHEPRVDGGITPAPEAEEPDEAPEPTEMPEMEMEDDDMAWSPTE